MTSIGEGPSGRWRRPWTRWLSRDSLMPAFYAQGGFRQGCALHLQRQQPKPRQQQQRYSEGWRGTVGLRGRRESVHGGLVAASMRLTPRKPTVPRLRQFPASSRTTPCVDESLSKSNISNLNRRASTHSVDLHVDQGRHPPTAAGNCRGRGGGGCGGVSAMDGATEPTGTYSRRPPQPDPPRQLIGNQLLLRPLPLPLPLPLPRRVQGAALQKNPLSAQQAWTAAAMPRRCPAMAGTR